MLRLPKSIGWIIILLIVGYIAFGILQGKISPSGKAFDADTVMVGDREVPVLRVPDCIDTDDGKRYFVKGYTYNIRDRDVKEDYCVSERVLSEFFCNKDYPDRILIPCNCLQGACG